MDDDERKREERKKEREARLKALEEEEKRLEEERKRRQEERRKAREEGSTSATSTLASPSSTSTLSTSRSSASPASPVTSPGITAADQELEAMKKRMEDRKREREETKKRQEEEMKKEDEERAKKAEERKRERERKMKELEDEEAEARRRRQEKSNKTKEDEEARKLEEQKAEELKKQEARKKEDQKKADEQKKEEERQAAEKREADRKVAEREEAARKEEAKKEADRKEAERKEAERKEAERKEAAKKDELARAEAAKKEEEKEAARKEEAKKEADRKEAERKESERKEAEKKEAAKKEAERKEAEAAKKEEERKEAARKEEAKKEADRKEVERKEAAKKEAEKLEAEERRKEEEKQKEEKKKEEAKRKEEEKKREDEKKKAEANEAARKEEQKQEEERRKEADKRSKEELEEAERKRKNDEAREKREAERLKAVELERQQEEMRKKKKEGGVVSPTKPVLAKEESRGVLQSDDEDDDEEDDEEDEKTKERSSTSEKEKRKKKNRTPEEEQKILERRERRQKEREALGLGPETKEERKQRRDEERKRKAEKLEQKERKLKEREDSGLLKRESSSKKLHKHREGSDKHLHKSRSNKHVETSAPSITTTPPTTVPHHSAIHANPEDDDDEKKLNTFLRIKGQAGRRLPTRISNRLSLPVGAFKSSPVSQATATTTTATTTTPTTSPSKGSSGGSILDIAIKAQERHKQQEREERQRVMKRLAEGKSTIEDHVTSPSEERAATPPPNPLLNGLASLALEAAQKQKSGSPLLRPKFSENRSRRQSTPIKPSPKLVSENESANYRAVLRQTAEAPERARLVHCKGKKRIHTREADPVTASLNKTDSFVLDCGTANPTIYVWNGPKSSPAKKSKGAAIAEIFKNHERGGHANIVKLDSGDDPAFWAALGGGNLNSVQEKWPLGSDEDAEKLWATDMKLFRVVLGVGDLVTFDEIPYKQLGMELLSSESYYVLDCGTELYLWVGKLSNLDRRGQVIAAAEEIIRSTPGRKSWVELGRVVEGGEPVLFREKFIDWPDLSHEVAVKRMGLGGPRKHDVYIPYEKRTHEKMLKFETSSLLESEYEPPEIKSNGEGELEIWKVEGSTRVAIRTERYGHFFAGHTYIITHTYYPRGAIRHMVVVWQGSTCSRNEAGSATLLIKDIVRDLSKTAETTQEVNQQQRASLQFYNLFSEKKVVVHTGEESSPTPSVTMFHIHGYLPARVHAEMIEPGANKLNSRDAFVVVAAGNAYLWLGRGASPSVLIPHAKTIAKKIAQYYSIASHTTVEEGSETDAFWKLIGGKKPYANMPYLCKSSDQFVPRLFAISNTGTILRADEVFDFQQVDLTPAKVVILDTGGEVFVWSGTRAPEKEKKRGMEIALEYVGLLKRPTESVLVINQLEEPLSFTAHFHPWVPFTAVTAALPKGSFLGTSPVAPAASSASHVLEKYKKKYSYSFLKQKNTPPEVDRTVLEHYLEDAEFAEIFRMTREEFAALPAWKQTSIKKTADLF